MNPPLENNRFKSLVRRKKTKSPTQKGFSKEEWERAWNSSSNNLDEDEMLFKAGLLFDDILSELREQISTLYKSSPRINPHQLIRAYCGMANRDRVLVTKAPVERGADITSLTTSSNRFNNKLTLQEVSDGCVDAVECAIRSILRGAVTTTSGVKAKDPLAFMAEELHISQLYGAYEAYWLAILWGDYHFIEVASEEKTYEIRQVASDVVVSYESSQIRNQKLAAQLIPSISDAKILSLLDRKGCIDIKREGKKRKILAKKVADLDREYKLFNALIFTKNLLVQDQFPESFLADELSGCGFSLNDVAEVFRVLAVFSKIIESKFPEDDSISSFNKAIEFCAKFNKTELVRGVSQATLLDFDRCTKIIDFLTFKGGYDEDLWYHPIIGAGGNDVVILTAALSSHVIQRCIEHWLTKLNVNLSDKGASYENTVLSTLREALASKAIFHDHEVPTSARIKLENNSEEEIDLIIRFGRVVIVGEVKSIVTTDSPISLYRTNDIIQGAAEQAKRKLKFVSDNIVEVFNKIGWTYSNEINYHFLPVILTSNSICVGYSANGIPVCDLQILARYFESDTVPLLSKSGSEHLAWFQLYADVNEAQSNIEKYLEQPPQLTLSKDDFDYEILFLPIISDKTPKIIYARLINKPRGVEDLIRKSKSSPFPVFQSPNFEEDVSKFDFIV